VRKYDAYNTGRESIRCENERYQHHPVHNITKHTTLVLEIQYCDKLANIVDRAVLTTFATIDVPSRKKAKFRVWDNVPESCILILEIAGFPSNAVQDKPREAS